MATRSLASMTVQQLLDLRYAVSDALSRSATELRQQLSRLTDGSAPHRGRRPGSTLKGRKVPSKYRSRKDPKLTWSGRGATPRWMTAEMKGTKLKREDFAISPGKKIPAGAQKSAAG
jgi:DNA-binding protein H-NS